MRPRFDPDSALGWDAIGLDGLSCFLRCVEAVLQSRGCSRDDVAQALVGPVDLLRSRSTDFAFRGCEIVWHKVADGRDHWDEIVRLVGEGEPLVLMPDRFFWPHDELHRAHHFQDHMVLAVECDQEHLTVLDTDAPPSEGFVRVMPVTDEVRRACVRYGVVVSRSPEPLTLPHLVTEILAPSIPWLDRDLASLRHFHETWTAEDIDDTTARALHIVVLGTCQPTFFVLATCLRSLGQGELAATAATAATADQAARRAKQVGVLLLAMHAQHTASMQALCRNAFGQLIDELDVLLDSMRRMSPVGVAADAEPRPADATERLRLHDRLRSVAESIFDAPRPSAVG